MRYFLRAAMAATLLGTTAAPALSQSQPRPSGREPRGSFEYFATSVRTDIGSQAQGWGGRLLLPLTRDAASPLSRVEVGASVAWWPDDDLSTRMLRYGGEAGVRLLSARAVEPVLSLGVGAVRRAEPDVRWRFFTGGLTPRDLSARGEPSRVVSVSERMETALAVAPGVGARVRLASGLALRGDLRRVFELGDGHDGMELSGGVSLPLRL
ncbi:MAG TPA: hypothetical protein VF746_29255 [Longimicrobium sp.]